MIFWTIFLRFRIDWSYDEDNHDVQVLKNSRTFFCFPWYGFIRWISLFLCVRCHLRCDMTWFVIESCSATRHKKDSVDLRAYSVTLYANMILKDFLLISVGYDQVWPDQVWPNPSLARPTLARPSLARTKFGQTNFGQDQIWPNHCVVVVCVCCCCCCCGCCCCAVLLFVLCCCLFCVVVCCVCGVVC